MRFARIDSCKQQQLVDEQQKREWYTRVYRSLRSTVTNVQTSNIERDWVVEGGVCSAAVRSQTEKFKLQILKQMGGGGGGGF